jgi:MFS family permease
VATDDNRGRYMGLFQAISRLGSAVAMLAGGILADVMGFQATFILFGMITCCAALPAYLEMIWRRSRPSPATSHVSPSAAVQPNGSVTMQTALVRGVHWRMAIASFGTFSTYLVIGGLVSATLGYVLKTRFGPAPIVGIWHIGIASLTGLLLSSRGFLDLGFAPVAGYLADRWGRHRIIVGAMPIGVVMVALLALLPSLAVVVVTIFLLFASGTTLNVAFNAVAGDIAPADKRSTYLGLFVTCQDLGAAIGPLLGYWIGPAFGLVWLYLSGAIILLIAFLCYMMTFARPGRRAATR